MLTRWMRGRKSPLNQCECWTARLVGYGTAEMAGSVQYITTGLVLQLSHSFLAVSECGDDFSTSTNLCPHCHLELGSVECYKQHIQSTTGSSGDTVYTCTICGFSASRMNGVKSHVRSHSKTKLFHLFGYDQKQEQQLMVKQLTEMSCTGTSVCTSVCMSVCTPVYVCICLRFLLHGTIKNLCEWKVLAIFSLHGYCTSTEIISPKSFAIMWGCKNTSRIYMQLVEPRGHDNPAKLSSGKSFRVVLSLSPEMLWWLKAHSWFYTVNPSILATSQ